MKPSRLTSLAMVFTVFAGLLPAGETPQSDQAAATRNAAEIETLKKQLAEKVRSEPAAASRLVQTWIRESDREK